MKIKNSLSNAERLDSILHLIENSKHVTVAQICQEFKVSAATARRDLDYLDQLGSIQRMHGGAVSLQKRQPQSPVFQRMSIQSENKQKIGVAAASLINPGDTLFLGSGTTVLEVAKNIKSINDLTVITNSLLVINELMNCNNITLVDLGGIVRYPEYSTIGNLTEAALSGLFVDKLIISVHGIDIDQGLTNHYIPETTTDRKLLQIGNKIMIVADHTKCGVISTTHVAPLSIITTLITDIGTPKEFVQELTKRGIQVIQA